MKIINPEEEQTQQVTKHGGKSYKHEAVIMVMVMMVMW
jgi:hypothetical protein